MANFPEELFKYRMLKGLAKYRHIEDNLYEDTTCSGHPNCIITVKEVDDHFELDELVNDSAKEYSSFHKYAYGDSHFYSEKNAALRFVTNLWIQEYEDKIKTCKTQIKELEKELSETLPKIKTTPQFIKDLTYGDEIFLLDSNNKVTTDHIECKVSGKGGVLYLLTEMDCQVRNTGNGEYLKVESRYEDGFSCENYKGFISRKALEDYRHNKVCSGLEEKLKDKQNNLKHNNDRIVKLKEDLEKFSV